MKKILLSVFTLMAFVAINAQNVNIPDVNFKNALINHSPTIDADGNGDISTTEAQNYTGQIYVANKSISDLTGIEAFVNATILNCGTNQLTSLNVSANTALTKLYCNNNQLTSLDVSANTALTELYCNNNQLTSLNVSANTALTGLYCNDNQLTSLDVSANTSLIGLSCYTNQLTSLDLSANTALTTFYCHANQLTSLNVANGNNGTLNTVYAINNPNLACIQHDTGFDPTTTSWQKDATAQWSDNCGGSSCANILNIPDANFKNALINHSPTIDTDGDGEICDTEAQNFTGVIYVANKSISDLTGIEAFVNATELYCNDNQLSSLNVSANTDLTKLYCHVNQLSSLDVSANTALTIIGCRNNQLTSLDVSTNTALTGLICRNNQLTSLDVSANTALTGLICRNNQLTSLNVANGNNGASSSYLNLVNATNNPNLACIQHDTGFDPTTANWQKDATAQWSDNCNSTILVNSINVQAQNGDSTISTNGGTLQMQATVLPINATDATYTWSVTNGTGSATIGTNGLLTATTNGIVTVTATANDGSGVSGSADITISNQGAAIDNVVFENLSIYPNPANDIINIEVQENLNSIQLFDITGKRIQTFHTQSKQLDVSTIKAGIYFLEIANSKKKSVIKIIKR